MDSDNEEEVIACDKKYVNFLRYLMTNRQVDKDLMIKIYTSIFKNDRNANYLAEKIATLNEMLEHCRLKIQDGICEVTGQNYYVLISTHFHPDTILPSRFNDHELEFIKNVIHEIIVSDFGMISMMKCLHLPKKITSTDAETLLKDLIEEKWFSEPKKGKLVLSAMAISELKPYIEANYKSVIERCVFCKRVVHFGEVCPSCKGKGHRFCVNKYAETFKKKMKCPSCDKEWTGAHYKPFSEMMECDDT